MSEARKRPTALRASLCAALIAASSGGTPAQAASCDLGATIFRDTLYGLGVGAAVGGVYLLARSDNEDAGEIVSDLASASLIGAGVGAIIGIVEASLCARGLASNEPGLQCLTPTAMVASASSPSVMPGLRLTFAF